MQRTGRRDGADVRRILIGMVTDNLVCGRISNQWLQFGLFNAEWSNLIGKWCVEYHRKYGSAPNTQITSIFEQWAGDFPDDDKLINLVERFLHHLSDESKSQDPKSSEYILDLAAKYFNKIRLQKAIEQAQQELEQGKVEEAQNRLTRSKYIDLELSSYIKPADDFEIWDNALSYERRRPLISYPGMLGKFFGDAFVKGEFYAFMGPDKTGKTTWLIDLTYRAIRRRNKVAFFDTGDGDKEEVIRRLACRSSGKTDHPCVSDVPSYWKGDNLIVKSISHGVINPVDAFRQFRKMSKSSDSFRVSCHPNSSISVDGINGILDRWAQEDWHPSVLVIDYADILAAPKGIQDTLEKIDETWKSLKRLSQERECLVVTATQSSAKAYGKEKGLLGRQHFSGRKTKLALVNGMIGIIATDAERDRQEARLNWIVKRRIRNRKDQGKFVTVAGCYDIENPAVISK